MPAPVDESLPFPESLCHICAAPPRYIKTSSATYIFCPIYRKYPPQPVSECEAFRPKEAPVDEKR